MIGKSVIEIRIETVKTTYTIHTSGICLILYCK